MLSTSFPLKKYFSPLMELLTYSRMKNVIGINKDVTMR